MLLQQLDSHDAAIWLFSNLEQLSRIGGDGWRGILPKHFSFIEVEEILATHGVLAGYQDSSNRSIEFFPISANVYESLGQLVSIPINRERVPGKYSIRGLQFNSTKNEVIPTGISAYISTVRLCAALKKRADVILPDGSLLFVKSHSDRLRVTVDFDELDLEYSPSLDDFVKTYFDDEIHLDQKRAVVRQSLLDMCKGVQDVDLKNILHRLAEFQDAVKSSYAMYLAEFTLDKVKAEIEKDNLDSAVKIGKAVSDIQNQILAMPAALILVGSQMDIMDSIAAKNLSLFAGASIFSWFMEVLIKNQMRTVDSISDEVNLRRRKISQQPESIQKIYLSSFDDLISRLADQKKILLRIKKLVVLGLVLSICLLAWSSSKNLRDCFLQYL